MSRMLPWIAAALTALVFGATLIDRTPRAPFNLADFGKLPAMHGGRCKPLDTIARATLLQINGAQTIRRDGKVIDPDAWLLDALTNPAATDALPMFRVDNESVQALLGDLGHAKNRFSRNDIFARGAEFTRAVNKARDTDKEMRDEYQNKVLELAGNLMTYEMVVASGLERDAVGRGKAALPKAWVPQKLDGQASSVVARYALQRPAPFPPRADDERMPLDVRVHQFAGGSGPDRMMVLINHWRQDTQQPPATLEELAQIDILHQIAIHEHPALYFKAQSFGEGSLFAVLVGVGSNEWLFETVAKDMPEESLFQGIAAFVDAMPSREGSINAAAPAAPGMPWRDARMAPATAGPWRAALNAWTQNDPDAFNRAVAALDENNAQRAAHPTWIAGLETRFQRAAPFYYTLIFYLLAMLLVLASWVWLGVSEPLRRAAVAIMIVCLVMHTGGIIVRMMINGRPPITNLYTTALFIGWASVVVGLVIEGIFRRGLGAAVACFIGFCTLVIGVNLSDGDNFEPLQAVLATNFWLATHVIIINLGYASTFLAAIMSSLYILRGALTRSLDKPTADDLNRMIYGMVAFGIMASFVGTVLGGIWADHSWGRFWGWDPKENGALMIVIWNALVLHARWGGLVRRQGVAVLASLGGIVTAWSWFGVNLLGKGLHAYGPISQGWLWLGLYVLVQLAVAALGCLPTQTWRSFEAMKSAAPASDARVDPDAALAAI